MREKVSAPITSARLNAPDLQQRVGRRQRIDEAGADRLQIEGGAVGDAERGLHRDRARRKGVVGRRGGQHDQVDRLRVEMGVRERRARRVRSHVRGEFAGRGDAALVDAGALHDPLVGGVDLARQIGIGQDLARQIAAAAENDRTAYSHEAAPLSACCGSPPACRPSAAVILASSSSRTTLVAELDRGGEALGIGAAVALDDDAVEAEKDPAIGAARVDPFAQLVEGGAREQIADPAAERASASRPADSRRSGGRCPRRS